MLQFYSPDGLERVGFKLQDGTLVEVKNVFPHPLQSFDVAPEELLLYEDTAVASWHTHPGRPANLSADDYAAFRMYPHLEHFILGSDGIKAYKVTAQGDVIQNGPA